MSHQNNTDLLELAASHIDYWEGTIWSEMIRHAVDCKDWERLEYLLKESAIEMFNIEYRPETYGVTNDLPY